MNETHSHNKIDSSCFIIQKKWKLFVNQFYSNRQTYFSFDSRAEQQMEVYLRYGQHPELYPNRRGEVVQG